MLVADLLMLGRVRGVSGDLGHLHVAEYKGVVRVLYHLVPVRANGHMIMPVADLAVHDQVGSGDGDLKSSSVRWFQVSVRCS